MNEVFNYLTFGLLLINLIGLVVIWTRMKPQEKFSESQGFDLLQQRLDKLGDQLSKTGFEQEALGKQVKALASDIEQRQGNHATALQQALTQFRTEGQNAQASLQQLVMTQFQQGSQTQTERLNQFSDTLGKTNQILREQVGELRTTVESRLKEIQSDNATKLEQMRKTVDEKLHATLEQRLGESFKQVSDRLEQVYRGLGEMQSLAAGVGDLKRVLTNVKTRGTWGEVQLQALLEQLLTDGQYDKNVKPVPDSSAVVEFAVKLPGKHDHDKPCWLPIDSKFPKEQYERLLDAYDRADSEAVGVEVKALEQAVKVEAKRISEKYLSPPHTTDFGILFLPTEGLYAEVVKRAGLVDELQRVYRVTVAGPVTLATLLNALQLGFKTLALEKRSSEVWQVLSAVKTEFSKFGDVLAKTKQTLEKAAKNIESAETRTRVMSRKLKTVGELPSDQAKALLEVDDDLRVELDDSEQDSNE